MAASTITRDTWTNDSGSAATPAGDGTIINNSALQNNVYARIDAMFAGSGSYTTFTVGGLFAAEGFGTHVFSAGGTGGQALNVRNTTAGTTNYATVQIGNDAAASAGQILHTSSTYTSGSYDQQDCLALVGSRAGGMSIAASHSSGVIRFYTGGVTKHAELSTTGAFTVGDGTVSLPAFSFTGDTDTGFYRASSGAVRYASNGVYITQFDSNGFILNPRDTGVGAMGPNITIYNNTNATTAVGGSITMVTKSSNAYYLWVDASGVLRIGSLANLQADTGGTVVGTQT